jgi:hypothetical protein
MSAVTLAELEMLRLALLHWRFKLTERLTGPIETKANVELHQKLLRRHRIVLFAASRGEVPACE